MGRFYCFSLSLIILYFPLSARAGNCKYDPGDLSSLRRALSDPACDVYHRANVVDALAKLGPEALPAVPELLLAIDAKHPPRCDSFECLGSDLVVPILIALKAIGPLRET